MKMYIVIQHKTDKLDSVFGTLGTQEQWDRYSQTRNPADKPSGSGPSPRVVVTNRHFKGAKRWAVKSC